MWRFSSIDRARMTFDRSTWINMQTKRISPHRKNHRKRRKRDVPHQSSQATRGTLRWTQRHETAECQKEREQSKRILPLHARQFFFQSISQHSHYPITETLPAMWHLHSFNRHHSSSYSTNIRIEIYFTRSNTLAVFAEHRHWTQTQKSSIRNWSRCEYFQTNAQNSRNSRNSTRGKRIYNV